MLFRSALPGHSFLFLQRPRGNPQTSLESPQAGWVGNSVQTAHTVQTNLQTDTNTRTNRTNRMKRKRITIPTFSLLFKTRFVRFVRVLVSVCTPASTVCTHSPRPGACWPSRTICGGQAKPYDYGTANKRSHITTWRSRLGLRIALRNGCRHGDKHFSSTVKDASNHFLQQWSHEGKAHTEPDNATQSVNPSTRQSVHPLIRESVKPPIRQSVNPRFRQSTHTLHCQARSR